MHLAARSLCDSWACCYHPWMQLFCHQQQMVGVSRQWDYTCTESPVTFVTQNCLSLEGGSPMSLSYSVPQDKDSWTQLLFCQYYCHQVGSCSMAFISLDQCSCSMAFISLDQCSCSMAFISLDQCLYYATNNVNFITLLQRTKNSDLSLQLDFCFVLD